MVYSEMGEQLLVEKKIEQAMYNFLYALSLTEGFYPAKTGLKKALKLKKLYKYFEIFMDITKRINGFDDLKREIDNLLYKLMQKQ